MALVVPTNAAVKGADPAFETCYDATVGPEIFDMPNSFATFKGTKTVGDAKERFNSPIEFANKSFRFSDGVVHHLREFLGDGETAAVFALNSTWALRLNTQMDFLPGFVQGQRFCKALNIPTVEIREKLNDSGESVLDQFPSEYVVVKRLYPKHFDDQPADGEKSPFARATALNLYQNWDRLDSIEREKAHQELKEFMVKLAPLETYFDFQPTNIVRTTDGWVFLDPSLASLEINFATPTSLIVPFAVPGKDSNNWFRSAKFKIRGEARKKLGEHVQAIFNYRRSHGPEITDSVNRGKAFLGIP